MQAPIDRIYSEGRRGRINEETVESLVKSMAVVGLPAPITVREYSANKNGFHITGYMLVAGADRLEAAKRLGWDWIDIDVVDADGHASKLAYRPAKLNAADEIAAVSARREEQREREAAKRQQDAQARTAAREEQQMGLYQAIASGSAMLASRVGYKAATPTPAAPAVQTMMIPVADISIKDRIRPASQATVDRLVDSIRESGLLHPITIARGTTIRNGMRMDCYVLVSGLHRLEAAKALGWTEIEAKVTGLEGHAATIVECDENLCGTTLTAAERALFTKRRKWAYEALHPETRAHVAGAHGSNAAQGNASAKLAPAFTADTAAKTGQAERTVQRDATRGAKIDPDVLTKIVGTELDRGVVLDELAAAPKEQQGAALEQIKASRSAPKPTIPRPVAAAVKQQERAAHDQDARETEAITAAMMPLAEAIRRLAETDPQIGEAVHRLAHWRAPGILAGLLRPTVKGA
ncbi:MAG: ParB N-terminal domain-containing protein [Bradyrhizobium sp.]|uniref:ParB N-terminal domain-containing protein n=1 Tax=Bradyrhizobium sp. TaxID=376 RepID=UPI003D12CC2F